MTKLNEGQLELFNKQGYIILENAFNEEEVQHMRAEADFIADLIIKSSQTNDEVVV
jgi:hypothetical protein